MLKVIKDIYEKNRVIILRLLGILLLASVIAGVSYGYWSVFYYRFSGITKGKVFKSGVIPPEKLEKFIKKYNIKAVLDLRKSDSTDPLNPGTKEEIIAENSALKKLGITHLSIPSEQVPLKETVELFLKIMDNDSYKPVLIHCYHGVGRAVLFSAIYRIEYEGWNNEEARKATRFITYGSSFSSSAPKGKFIKNYVPRKKK